jgi:alcohol dehydrogenase
VNGQAQVCPEQTQPGFTHWGSIAEYVALHGADANLVAVSEVVGDAARLDWAAGSLLPTAR